MNDLMQTLLNFQATHPNCAGLLAGMTKALAILAMASGLATLLQRRSARARAWIWRLALLALLLVAAWPLRPAPLYEAAITLTIIDHDRPVLAAPVVAAEVPKAAIPTQMDWLQKVDHQLLRGWWLGFVLFALWMLSRQMIGRAGLWLAGEKPDERIRALCPPALRCRVSRRATSPLITGVWRSTVWLPLESTAWDKTRLRAAFQHELAHHQRRDVAWQLLGTLAACAWWWLPFSWLALGRLKSETEQAADDWTVGVLNPTDYAEALVRIASAGPSTGASAVGIPMAATGDELEARVSAVLRLNPWRNRLGLLAASALMLLALGFSGVVLVSCQRRAPSFVSLAKLMVAARPAVAGSVSQGHESLQSLSATTKELLESSLLRKRAIERLKALHPGQKETDVEVRATQMKDSTIINVAAIANDRDYAKLFLNALLDEIVAFRESSLTGPREKAMAGLMDNVTRQKKELVVLQQKAADFASANGIIPGSNPRREMLRQYTAEKEKVRAGLDEVELALKDVGHTMAMKRMDATVQRPGSSSSVLDAAGLTRSELEYLNTRNDMTVCQVEIDTLKESNKPESSIVLEAKARLSRLQKLLQAYMAEITEGLAARKAALEKRLIVLEARVEETTKGAADMDAKEAEYSEMVRGALAANRDIEQQSSMAQAIQSAGDGAGDQVSVMERASTAVEDVQPWWRF